MIPLAILRPILLNIIRITIDIRRLLLVFSFQKKLDRNVLTDNYVGTTRSDRTGQLLAIDKYGLRRLRPAPD
jgi:hypothetical protein